MKASKYIEYLTTKVKTAYKEKVFIDGTQKIKYILEADKNSNELIVVFSGCTRTGVKARYNYNRTLKKFDTNKLYILDDQGIDGRGIFYLGKDSKFDTEKSVNKLIDKFIEELNIKKIFCIGSSKGGYAALYFGLEKKATIIIGAPQYYLGNYLNCEANKHILKYILGDINDKKIKELNLILQKKLAISNEAQIFMQYSNLEHTYDEHIKFLIEDIKKYNINCKTECMNYLNHSDVSLFFPEYLIKILTEQNIKRK